MNTRNGRGKRVKVMANDTTKFGRMLADARVRLGLAQHEVASRLGITQSGYSGYETGDIKYTPSPEVLARLEQLYGYSQAEMLAALGYNVSVTTISEATRAAIIRDAAPAEYVSIHYGVSNPAAIVAGMEVSAYGQQYIEHRAKDREGSGPNPIG